MSKLFLLMMLTAALLGCGSGPQPDSPEVPETVSPEPMEPAVPPTPTPVPTGTARGIPGLDPASVEIDVLNGQQVRVRGLPGAAGGSHLFIRAGEVDAMEAEDGEHPGWWAPLSADGSFLITLPLVAGEPFTLWAVGRDGGTLQSTFLIPEVTR